jgi:hypothetical protein
MSEKAAEIRVLCVWNRDPGVALVIAATRADPVMIIVGVGLGPKVNSTL